MHKNDAEALLAMHAALREFAVKLAVLVTVLVKNKLITEDDLVRCEKEVREPVEAVMKPLTPEQMAEMERKFPGFTEFKKEFE